MKISPYTIYLEMQPNALLVRQNFIIYKKWVLHRGSSSCLPARGSFRATTCRLGSSTRLLAQGSSGAATCPVDGLYKRQAIKQIFPSDSAIMIFIGVRACVSTKALCDKGCSACLQGMQ
jgi:hypothetical protein